MIKCLLVFVTTIILASCHQLLKPDVPDVRWDLFDSSMAQPLKNSTRKKLEGVYTIEGEKKFGPMTALKWSYTIKSKDTVYQLSMFCEEDAAYFICEGKRLDNSILLRGYWRKLTNTETGRARFTITLRDIKGVSDDSISGNNNLSINGVYGSGDSEPDKKLQLKYIRPLYNKRPLEIIGHRGGGRIGDLLPASENSVQLIEMASRLGATGVEIDVQITKDGIPVLYHDSRINDRLTHKAGVRGELKNYTYAELTSEVRLKNDEKIPTLKEALNSIIYNTPIRYVWLDAKDTTRLEIINDLQQEALQAAAAIGRHIEITIGIHDENVFNKFLLLPDFKNIPSLCELEPAYVTTANARIWAPLWTEGLQPEKVQAMKAQGKRAFVWTIDQPKQIKEFMFEGNYDGIVSNYASLVAYYYYTRE